MSYADPVALTVEWLQQQFPDALVCTETDDTIGQKDVIWVSRVGGGPQKPTLDKPLLYVNVYGLADNPDAGTGDGHASKLCYDVWSALLNEYKFHQFGFGIYVNNVENVSGPQKITYANDRARCFGVALLVTVRTSNL